jgi:hypothetical protein
MNEDIEKIIPPKMSSIKAKKIYKEMDGFKRSLSKISGVNEDLLGSIDLYPDPLRRESAIRLASETKFLENSRTSKNIQDLLEKI